MIHISLIFPKEPGRRHESHRQRPSEFSMSTKTATEHQQLLQQSHSSCDCTHSKMHQVGILIIYSNNVMLIYLPVRIVVTFINETHHRSLIAVVASKMRSEKCSSPGSRRGLNFSHLRASDYTTPTDTTQRHIAMAAIKSPKAKHRKED